MPNAPDSLCAAFGTSDAPAEVLVKIEKLLGTYGERPADGALSRKYAE